ncbi:MAG TPA: hypothetical protein VLH35_04565 [Candidatus Acidoferrales bacterium]|nr:hypothetical protein [Candidatus Acidoferrales bacterium]
MTTIDQTIKQTLHDKAPYILVAAVALLIYETYLLQKSFLALYQIYQNITLNAGPDGVSAGGYMWFFSEVSGEIGLILRFAGALFFVAFAVLLLKKKPALTSLKRGILLEAIQYLFLIPFITQWVIFSSGIRSYETIFSFTMQIVLITPTLLMLYLRLKRPQTSQTSRVKAAAIAGIAFMFAMWIKHFFFNLYALPISFSNPVLTAGFVNSALTLLVSALILVVVFLPFIRGKSASFSFKGLGVAFLVASAYFFVYLAIATVNSGYQSFLLLTELWMVSMVIVGAGFVIGETYKES